MNERYTQTVIVGVLVGGAILLAEMIGAGNVQGPANAESSSASLVFSGSAKQSDELSINLQFDVDAERGVTPDSIEQAS